MKKWSMIAAVMLMLGYLDALPFEHADAGALCVVETLLVEADQGGVTLYSVDGAGWGENIKEAEGALLENVPGQLFLRQVKRVIFCNGAEERVDLMEMPEEVPLGAHIYQCAEEAQVLLEHMEREEKRLSARERREKDIPTLAKLQNEVLKRHD